MKNAVLFPGQGSQFKGMGTNLFGKYKREFEAADEILYYSTTELLENDINEVLDNTLYTQPALYIVNSLTYNEMIKETGMEISYAAGHSLGEFSALYAAGVYDFATGLKIVAKRSKLMNRVQNGAMAAITGLDENKIINIIKAYSDLYIANYNMDIQTVISGKKDTILAVRKTFLDNGAGFHILNVSCPCHCPLLNKAADDFRAYLEQFSFNLPQFGVISNYTGKEYEFNSMKDTMALQMCSPVKWKQSISYLVDKGVGNFEIAGPPKVLEGMLKHNLREVKRA